MRAAAALAALLAPLVLAACAYRLAPPTAIGEAIRVQVVADEGRFPRLGAYLQEEVADRLAVQTGWRVRPDGSARLDLSIDGDRISANADDSIGVPTRWRVTVRCTALLVTRLGTRTHDCTGTGYASSREQEPAALRAAAVDAANALASWLQQVDLGKPGAVKSTP